ncbi:MAG: hypothetical protein QNK37_01700 [Acidobacteriota bacterium]|nr:hypothetical protein [Acidobacteriota bacterium]
MTPPTVALLLLALFQGPEPIHVKPGDPVIDLKIRTLDGRSVALTQVLDNSFCFFLSPNCPACMDALPYLQQAFVDYHVVLIFIDETPEIDRWIRRQNFSQDVYLVKAGDLEPFNIKTLPALLAYRDQKLKFGFHGPIDAGKCRKMITIFEGPS